MREAKNNGNYKFSDREMFELARLGAIRIWGLKKRLYAERKQLKLNL